MDSSDQIALAALIVSGVLSTVAVVVSVISYKRSAKAAERSATAAEEALALQRAQAEKYEPHWDVQWRNGETYTIRNRCGERCEQVTVSYPGALVNVQVPATLENGEGGSFIATGAVADRSITVTWRRPGSDEVFTRKYPLPTLPPKALR